MLKLTLINVLSEPSLLMWKTTPKITSTQDIATYLNKFQLPPQEKCS